MKNIAITGANGFLGSTLCRRLVKAGYRVVGLIKDRNYKSRGEVLSSISVVHGDLRDYDTLRYMFAHYEIDTVFHLGAVTILRHSVVDPVSTYEINVLGTVNVLEAARQTRVKKVISKSTDKSYGTYNNMPYVETMAVQASSDSYSTSKACMDLISQQYADGFGLDVSIIRCGNAYGPGDLNLSRLVPGSILKCLKGEKPTLHAGVQNYAREFMYSDDVIDAYLTVAEHGKRGEAYNIGGSGRVTVYDTVKMIMQKMGMTDEPETVECDFKEIKDQWLDSSKLRALGWSSKYSLDSGLDRTIEWYKKYKKSCDFFEGDK